MGKNAAATSGKKRSREQQKAAPAPVKAAPAAASARKHKHKQAQASSSDESDDESDADSDDDASANANKDANSDEEEDSDDSDSETENALFRPAPTKQDASDASSSDSSSSDDDEEEDKVEEANDDSESEEAASVKEAAKPAAKKTAASKSSAKASEDIDANIQEEMDKKTEATVYVEGIPYQADEGDVVSHFSSCGIVKEVRMPRWQDSGRPRGYAHVVFESEAAIPKALALDGKYLFKRYLSVRRAQTPRTLELALKETKSVKKAVVGCKTVFIKQLPYDVEEQTIRDALASCGTITSIRLPLWNHTKKLKGFGYVEFTKEDEAVAAVKRSGMKVGGRMVIINLDVAGAPKASFRQADGQYWNKTEEAKKSLAKKLADKVQRAGAASKKRKVATK